ncbi:glycosyltransferase family A protein [Nocardioides zeae]|uniref:Glycosyltransferase family A protein n=1 Tax=Nocardioides imazamoxiresistens TaxID=3231893 RepID=A0ABU3PWE7_9ACTN|nr:glycosyltransferase family A protein [Nocardioides zeae]MDT9593563.1 glycosyltransferase family A protein [Nocardioides zeae]
MPEDVVISIILTAYNDEERIPETIDRMAKTAGFDDCELVVVDDHSTDGTLDVIRSACSGIERALILPLPENGGVAAARRRGLAAASGRFIWFIDSDDAWPDQALSSWKAAISENPTADVIFGQARVIHLNGETRIIGARIGGSDRRSAFASLLSGNVRGHLWSKLFRRELLVGSDILGTTVHSDLAMTVSAMARAEVYAVTPARVYEYMLRPGSIIRSGRPRAESLIAIDQRLSAVLAADPTTATPEEHASFRHRFILLSLLTDSLNEGYTPIERRDLVRRVRQEIEWLAIARLARSGGSKQAALLAVAKLSSTTANLAARILIRAAR